MSLIKKVSIEQAEEIIETKQPIGLFYTVHRAKNKNIYAGIGNRAGDATVETFCTMPAKKT
jgi:preprotein translocase subunit SecA